MAEKLKQADDIFNIIVLILLILFSIFIIYQLLRIILGGSWAVESIIITLLVLIIGFLFSQAKTLGKVESDNINLKNSFLHLVTDFKTLAKDFREHATKKKH